MRLIFQQHPNYNDKASRVFLISYLPPQDLPDPFRGERWVFVQLPASKLEKEIQSVKKGNFFGSSIEIWKPKWNIRPEIPIPGVAVFSRRAFPLAAWTNGLELVEVTADPEKGCLILDSGLNERWRYGSYRKSEATNQEAIAWETVKQCVNGWHFLVIQTDPASVSVAGLWIMRSLRISKL